MKKKKYTTGIVISFAVFLFASCKKDYSCSCSGNGTDSNNTTYDVAVVYTYKKTKEKDAKSECSRNQSALSTQNGGIAVICAIGK